MEQADGKRFIVMELAEGETLAKKISRGSLPVDEALAVCRQIAEGLEAAHEKGIVHRDLKPSNVMVSVEGKVKILDFGLAKAFQGDMFTADASRSPTLTDRMTRPGMILGTAAYMAPEQAKGKSVDKRADVWALGCVLYECLTGRRAFQGESVTETLASVLRGEPDWSALPADTPQNVQRLLRRCLRKNRKERLHDIADARIEIDDGLQYPDTAEEPRARTRRLQVLPWTLALLSSAVLVAFLVIAPGRVPLFPASVKRFTIPLGPVRALGSATLALSPDGRELAYTIDGRLFRRPLDQLSATRVGDEPRSFDHCFFAGTDWVGVHELGSLTKVLLTTGALLPLSESPAFYGAGGWPEDALLFVPGAAMGIWQVPPQGGRRSLVVGPDFDKGERSYRWPEVLPGHRAFLFTRLTTQCASFDDAEIVAYSLEDRTTKAVVSGGTFPKYARNGYVLFARSGNVQALPFDLKTLEPKAGAKTVLEGVQMDRGGGSACFDVSNDGTLAYIPGGVINHAVDIVRVERNGRRETILKSEPLAGQVWVSPDGTKLAFVKNDDIWVYDLSLMTQTRITFDAGLDMNPIWSFDSRRLTFASNRRGTMDIYEKSADGTGPATRLYESSNPVRPMSWSQDGNNLALVEESPTSNDDIWLLSFPRKGAPSARRFASSAFHERQPAFSPDGRWVAYVSNESGEFDVYLQPSSGTGQRRKISTRGGIEPMWNPNGREIVFFHGADAFSVTVETTPGLATSLPSKLFGAPDFITSSRNRNSDISRDGSSFFVLASSGEAKELQINIVLNWFEELTRLVPAANK